MAEKVTRWTPDDPDDERSRASAAALNEYEKRYGQLPVRTPEEEALLVLAAQKGEENQQETR